jgi:hypothetical protein
MNSIAWIFEATFVAVGPWRISLHSQNFSDRSAHIFRNSRTTHRAKADQTSKPRPDEARTSTVIFSTIRTITPIRNTPCAGIWVRNSLNRACIMCVTTLCRWPGSGCFVLAQRRAAHDNWFRQRLPGTGRTSLERVSAKSRASRPPHEAHWETVGEKKWPALRPAFRIGGEGVPLIRPLQTPSSLVLAT